MGIRVILGRCVARQDTHRVLPLVVLLSSGLSFLGPLTVGQRWVDSDSEPHPLSGGATQSPHSRQVGCGVCLPGLALTRLPASGRQKPAGLGLPRVALKEDHWGGARARSLIPLQLQLRRFLGKHSHPEIWRLWSLSKLNEIPLNKITVPDSPVTLSP